MSAREIIARAVATRFISAYADDQIWTEDLPLLLRRAELGRGGPQDNPFGIADAILSALREGGWAVVPAETLQEGATITENLISHLAYHDSYGVHGSDFYVCHACHEGGAPGAWSGHKDNCPVFAVETWVSAMIAAAEEGE